MDLDITFGLQLVLLLLLCMIMGPVAFQPLLAVLNRRAEALEQLPVQTQHLRATCEQRQAALSQLQQQGQQALLAAEQQARHHREGLLKELEEKARKSSAAFLQAGRLATEQQMTALAGQLSAQIKGMEEQLLAQCLPQAGGPQPLGKASAKKGQGNT